MSTMKLLSQHQQVPRLRESKLRMKLLNRTSSILQNIHTKKQRVQCDICLTFLTFKLADIISSIISLSINSLRTQPSSTTYLTTVKILLYYSLSYIMRVGANATDVV